MQPASYTVLKPQNINTTKTAALKTKRSNFTLKYIKAPATFSRVPRHAINFEPIRNSKKKKLRSNPNYIIEILGVPSTPPVDFADKLKMLQGFRLNSENAKPVQTRRLSAPWNARANVLATRNTRET